MNRDSEKGWSIRVNGVMQPISELDTSEMAFTFSFPPRRSNMAIEVGRMVVVHYPNHEATYVAETGCIYES